MPEELTLQKRCRYGSTIDGDKRFFSTIGTVMYPFGNQLLAGARFSLHQNRGGFALGNLIQHLHQILGLPALSDNIGCRLFGLGAEPGHLALEIAIFQSFFDNNRELIKIKRLADVIVRPQTHGIYSRFQATMGGQHDDDNLVIKILDFFQHLDTADTGQLNIEQDEIGLLFANQAQGILAGTSRNDLIALLFQILFQ